jgi:opine dehydrogenase
MRIGVIGAGNGGKAMAAHFSLMGHTVYLFNRSYERIERIVATNTIHLNGLINHEVKINKVGSSWQEAVQNQDIVMVCTTANAHHDVAKEIAPYISAHQIIVLNPGRTLGAIAFKFYLSQFTATPVYIAEAQSLVYACRSTGPNTVSILGIKKYVPLAAYPSTDTQHVLQVLNRILNAFVEAQNCLSCSLNNIGAILHPCISLLNAQSIAHGHLFYFYRNLDADSATLLEKLDLERLALGKALDVSLISLSDWVSLAYDNIEGETLVEKIKNNPAYYDILSPTTLHSRMLLEDIPTGLMPMIDLGKQFNVDMPLMNSICTLCQTLLNTTFEKEARLLHSIGLGQIPSKQLMAILRA